MLSFGPAEGAAAAIDFRILGSLEAWEDGRRLPLGGPKQRALLARLLLADGDAVSVDELVETLWPGDAPASAPHAVEVYVSRLRKVLHGDGRSRLTTNGRGYALEVAEDEVDARRFAALVERARAEIDAGRPEPAAGMLGAALALWRGDAFVELSDAVSASPAVARLAALRLEALEARFDVELARGRHAAVVAELEATVAAEPLHERFRAQLMVALYRCGRQAEALDAYRTARAALRDELGLEPSPRLRELERAILRHDAGLDSSGAEQPRRRVVSWPVTPLVGRESELSEVLELVGGGGRLVTITGTGGIGKTRLALEVARRLEHEYEDGVALAELAPVRSPELVLHAIADVFGVREQRGVPLLETLVGALGDCGALLVLDNFEHVLDAAPVASRLVSCCRRMTVLVTSRTRLRLYGEHEYPVPPLGLPDLRERSVDEIARSEAVQLFVGCTRRHNSRFALHAGNAAAVSEICIRLDGVPLAIELAAAHGPALPPRALLTQLASRLPVLIDGPRDAPARQQSLRATIDWSYDLLSVEERRLLRGLSVFVGGFTADAAGAVCGAAARALDSLVEKNLVVGDRAEQPRFSLLETIREYALELLAESGALESMRERHAEHFVGLAERAEPELRGPAQVEWFAQLDDEQSNLWAAFSWALDAGRLDVPLRFGAALWRFWEARGTLTEARRRLDAALELATSRRVGARAGALFGGGRMALRHGDLEYARRAFAEACALYAEAQDDGGVALCTAGIGWVAHVVGPVDEAIAFCRRAVDLARRAGEPWITADALNNLGVALRSGGDLDGSRAALEQSLAIRKDIGELEGVTAALNGLALIAIARDDFDEAETLFAQAFAISEQRGDLFYAAAKDVVFAYLAFGRGDLAGATVRSIRALESCREHGYRQFAAYALETLAGIAAAEGRPREAARILGAAVAIAEQLGRGAGGEGDGVTYDWEARAVKAAIERARRELDADAWAAAMREGRRLEIAEVVAFAEEWTPAVTTSPPRPVAGASLSDG